MAKPTTWWLMTARHRDRAGLEPPLSRHELPAVGAMDRSVLRHRPCASDGTATSWTGCVARLEHNRPRFWRRADVVPIGHYADAVVPRIHVQSLLVAIQVASVQLTPRIIATTLLRNRVVKYCVGLFVYTLLFCITALNHQGTTVRQLTALVGAVLGIACIAAFLFLIDYAARLLRPVSILAHVGDEGIVVIESVYPASIGSEHDVDRAVREPTGPPRRVVRHVGSSANCAGGRCRDPRRCRQPNRWRDRVRTAGGRLRRAGEPLFRCTGALTRSMRMLRGG